MTEEVRKKLEYVNKTLTKAEVYQHAATVLQYDQETICPPKGMEEQGEVSAFMMNKAFALEKGKAYTGAIAFLHEHIKELDEFDRAMIDTEYRSYVRNKNITPAMQHRFSLVYNKAFVDWVNAKQQADFSIFEESLKKVREIELKKISLRENAKKLPYDELLDDYEQGMTSGDLDAYFGTCRERLVPLLQKIVSSKKRIRTDFLSRTVTEAQQKEMAQYLLKLIGFDFERGAFTTSEHPFTDGLARNDIRVTTHYYPDMFYSSMFSIIHEGGHALFEQYQPQENYDHHLNNKTMGQHESVSRFYENRIGRSKSFIHLIYPKAREIFPQVLSDVSEQELYEAMNTVQPSLIRTESDEFTYTFHIMIRYELEKQIVNGGVEIADLPALWNRKYEEYLGIRPQNDRDGVLQDMHWASGFGYFPAYALGNMYNAMYYNRMQQDFDIEEAIAGGHLDRINDWMKEHVWKKADRQDPRPWIKEITGRDFTPDDFLDYLEKKYTEIYEL